MLEHVVFSRFNTSSGIQDAFTCSQNGLLYVQDVPTCGQHGFTCRHDCGKGSFDLARRHATATTFDGELHLQAFPVTLLPDISSMIYHSTCVGEDNFNLITWPSSDRCALTIHPYEVGPPATDCVRRLGTC